MMLVEAPPKTIEEQITEDVLEAYHEHGLSPVEGRLLIRSHTGNHFACAIGALCHEKIVDEYSTWIHVERISEVMHERYGWDRGQIFSFELGFDAGFTDAKNYPSPYPERAIGYAVGQRVREEFC